MPRKKGKRAASAAPLHIAHTLEPDPYSPPGETRQVVLARSVRDDPLAGLYTRRQIDRQQYDAGRQWQALWSTVLGSALRGADPTRQHVDVSGRVGASLTDRQMDAFRELGVVGRILGVDGDRLVCMVLGDALAIREVCRRWGGDLSEPRLKYMGARFRECLETMATHWRIAPP